MPASEIFDEVIILYLMYNKRKIYTLHEFQNIFMNRAKLVTAVCSDH